ncbi:hypothetical protein LZ30DRAFT_364624 [Colletotrichum cereale]|nr:hypothetical protein LZ30DRAFT_364624 [Colletotrichum cereale]
MDGSGQGRRGGTPSKRCRGGTLVKKTFRLYSGASEREEEEEEEKENKCKDGRTGKTQACQETKRPKTKTSQDGTGRGGRWESGRSKAFSPSWTGKVGTRRGMRPPASSRWCLWAARGFEVCIASRQRRHSCTDMAGCLPIGTDKCVCMQPAAPWSLSCLPVAR